MTLNSHLPASSFRELCLPPAPAHLDSVEQVMETSASSMLDRRWINWATFLPLLCFLPVPCVKMFILNPVGLFGAKCRLESYICFFQLIINFQSLFWVCGKTEGRARFPYVHSAHASFVKHLPHHVSWCLCGVMASDPCSVWGSLTLCVCELHVWAVCKTCLPSCSLRCHGGGLSPQPWRLLILHCLWCSGLTFPGAEHLWSSWMAALQSPSLRGLRLGFLSIFSQLPGTCPLNSGLCSIIWTPSPQGFFSHSLTNGCHSCFQVWTVLSNTAVNICMWALLFCPLEEISTRVCPS